MELHIRISEKRKLDKNVLDVLSGLSDGEKSDYVKNAIVAYHRNEAFREDMKELIREVLSEDRLQMQTPASVAHVHPIEQQSLLTEEDETGTDLDIFLNALP